MDSHFEKGRVLVVGDVILDRYYNCITKQISQEAPVPVASVHDVDDRAGGAANVALNVAALGATVGICGTVGKDESSDVLSKIMVDASIVTSFVTTNAPTTTKVRILSRTEDSKSQHDLLSQHLLRLDFEKEFSDEDGLKLLNKIEHIINEYNVIILSLSDTCDGTLKKCKDMIAIAKSKNIPILVDPKGDDFSIFAGATILTPNRKEFETAVGKCFSDVDLIEKAHELIDKHDLGALLITRDEEGMTLVTNNEDMTIPSEANTVVDVNGAGDTVIAVMATAISCGHEISEATRLSNMAAGVVVGKQGTATCNLCELNNCLNKNSMKEEFEMRGIISVDDLKKELIVVRQRNEKIVMTNGCFDLLHGGHVETLQKARAMGDCLIVAVNSDDSVKRLKGEGRPILSLTHRTKILAALECVDWVISFVADTPIDLIKDISPDILVKGGDYKISEIVGVEEISSAGGMVEAIPSICHPNFSSSKIIEKCKGN